MGTISPAFQVYPANGVLVVGYFESAPHVAPRPFEALIGGPVWHNPPQEAMSRADLDVLRALPPYRARRAGRTSSCTRRSALPKPGPRSGVGSRLK